MISSRVTHPLNYSHNPSFFSLLRSEAKGGKGICIPTEWIHWCTLVAGRVMVFPPRSFN